MDVLATGYGLIEGPAWDAELGLLFSDVLGGGVHRVDRSGIEPVAVGRHPLVTHGHQ